MMLKWHPNRIDIKPAKDDMRKCDFPKFQIRHPMKGSKEEDFYTDQDVAILFGDGLRYDAGIMMTREEAAQLERDLKEFLHERIAA